MKRFIAYGERIHSTFDLAPFLPQCDELGPSTRLAEGEVPVSPPGGAVLSLEVHGRRVTGHCSSPREVFAQAQSWWVEIEGICRFAWRDNEPGLVVYRHPGVSSGRVVFWFLHIVLPFYLSRSRSLLFLHAGAVALDGTAIALTAPTGTGKSSLVAGCLERGSTLVTDDKLAIRFDEAGVMALPSHPHCRDYRASEDLGRRVSPFSGKAVTLGALCVVSREAGLSAPRIELMKGARRLQAAMPSLLYHFSGDALTPATDLARLVNHLPTFLLVMPNNAASIGASCDAVLAALVRGDGR